jgi:23S rRNA (uracil-5-)-methyltransferase RumA
MKICRHFNICGGCKLQDLTYSKQLQLKTNLIKKRADKYGIDLKRRFKNILPSPVKYDYRNKMEFTFYAEEDGGLCLGLHGNKQNRRVIELKECLIGGREVINILKKTLDYGRKNKLKGYHRFRQEGYLRHLLIRKSMSSKELMVIIVTTSRGRLKQAEYVKRLLSLRPSNNNGYKISSIFHVVNDSPGDAISFEKVKLLYGKEFLEEKIGRITYRIYNQSFFQTNSVCLKVLYNAAKKLISPEKTDRILDLFCGSGGVGLYLAKGVEEVCGIEINEQAIIKAHENMEINGIKNMSFMQADVRIALKEKLDELKGRFNKVIIDPPRAGISRKVFERVVALEIPEVLYISCNPESLFDNIRLFIEAGYKLKAVQPVDMFPHTRHVECLVSLAKV